MNRPVIIAIMSVLLCLAVSGTASALKTGGDTCTGTGGGDSAYNYCWGVSENCIGHEYDSAQIKYCTISY